jgi:hypothetical protein
MTNDDKPSLAPSLGPSLAPQQRLAPRLAPSRSSISRRSSQSKSFDDAGRRGSTSSQSHSSHDRSEARHGGGSSASSGQTTVASQLKKKAEASQAASRSSGPDKKTADKAAEEVVEVDPNAEKQHALGHDWTMWYDTTSQNHSKPTTNEGWQSNVKKIANFSTVEDFWKLYNNLPEPSRLTPSSNYHLFKAGVMPAWEDPMNDNGGKWTIELQRGDNELLNSIWLNALLAMVGEAFEDPEEICGCVVSLRGKRNRMSLWTKTAHNESVQKRVGRQFKEFLELPSRQKIGYQEHNAAKSGGRAYSRSGKYEV